MDPSPGRIVHFHEEGGPYPAIVTAVNPDGTVELATFGRNSLYFQHNVAEARPLPLGSSHEASELKGKWTRLPRTA